MRWSYGLETTLEGVKGAHFGGSAAIKGERPANRRDGRMPQGNMVPRFARPAFLPSKEGAEGRDFVE